MRLAVDFARLAGLLWLILAATVAEAQDAARLARALDAADRRDYAAAAAEARGADPVVGDLVEWRRLQRGDGGYAEALGFLRRRADWPRAFMIREEAERIMPPGRPLSELREFFGESRPRTGAGSLRLAEALRAAGDEAAARAEITRAWTRMALNEDERRRFESGWGEVVRPLAAERLDAMLWRGEETQARAVLPLVGPDLRRLAEARMALRARRPGVDALIDAVPRSLANDPGLAFERFLWRDRAGFDVEAESMLARQTGSESLLGRPEAWADRRVAFVREAFRQGRAAEAYRLASLHQMSAADGWPYADLEFLAGWIALRGLGDAARAAEHFVNLWNGVETPISKGRGGYWAGRAFEALGRERDAAEWYRRAAEHSTSFYGQLAAEKIGLDPTPALAETLGVEWPDGSFASSDWPRVIRLLQEAGHKDRALWFIEALADDLTAPRDFAALADLAVSIGRPDGAVRTGKAAAGKGIVVMDAYYPTPPLLLGEGAVEPALAMAIARQESELNPEAVSPAGARGFMQLMPGTAQKVSRDLGIAYRPEALLSDPAYNARLGKTYLAEQLAAFAGAKALAAAAYNAGPSRAQEWIGRFGDPRRPEVDAVDWVETIPFNETRNYVQRVLEGLHVYRARLGEPRASSYAAAITRPQG